MALRKWGTLSLAENGAPKWGTLSLAEDGAPKMEHSSKMAQPDQLNSTQHANQETAGEPGK